MSNATLEPPVGTEHCQLTLDCTSTYQKSDEVSCCHGWWCCRVREGNRTEACDQRCAESSFCCAEDQCCHRSLLAARRAIIISVACISIVLYLIFYYVCKWKRTMRYNHMEHIGCCEAFRRRYIAFRSYPPPPRAEAEVQTGDPNDPLLSTDEEDED